MDMNHVNGQINGLISTHATRGMPAIQAARAIVGSIPMVARGIITTKGKKPIKVVLSPPTGLACTDTTSYIQVPKLPIPASEADIQSVMDGVAITMGLLHHEVGHVNHSNIDVIRGTTSTECAQLLNIIEDVRMECAHIRDIPSARRYLDASNWVLHKQRRWAISPPEDAHPSLVLRCYVMAYLNSHFRQDPVSTPALPAIQAVMDRVFTPQVRSGLDTLMDSLPRLSDTADALSLAEAILAFLRQQQQKAQQQTQQKSSSEEEKSDGSAEKDSGSNPDSDQDREQEQEQEQEQGDSQGNADGDQDKGEGDEQSTEAPSESQDPSDGCDDESQSTEDASLAARLGQAAAGDPSDKDTGDKHDALREVAASTQSTLETIDLEQAIEQVAADFTRKGRNKAEDEDLYLGADHPLDAVAGISSSIRRRVLNELDAITHAKVQTGRRGRTLSSRHLHRVSSGEDKVFQQRTEGVSLSTSILLVQDVSGSMYGARIETSAQALYATALAFEGIDGVEVAAMAFPGNGKIIGFNESVRRNKARFQLQVTGSTPMDEAIMAGCSALLKQDTERKIMMVLTDGVPDHPGRTQAMIAMAESQGIEVFAIGIQTMAVRSHFKQCTTIHELATLPSQLVGMIKNKVMSTH